MPEWLATMMSQFQSLSPARQATFVVTALGSLAFFYWISVGMSSSDYRLLYRGLEAEEIAQIIDGLVAERIEYRIAEGGSAIEVPSSKIHEARIRIASRGLPSGDAPGFELFDQGTFGVTDFVQKVNYHRALQGELARTIEGVEGVEKARVQLALPERKGLLRKDDRKATASIVARLREGRDLEPEQVRGIVHLVASSVEGLEPSHVTLVDNRGRLLSPQPGTNPGGRGTGSSIGAERRIEEQLERQIEEILGRTVGLGRVVAKVRASLDWTQTEKTEELFDPDSQVERSTQVDSERSTETRGEGGVAGIVANSPEAAPGAGSQGSGASSVRTSETVNFEISKVVARHMLPVGRIERLSVAVLVDGRPIGSRPGAEADGEAPLEESEPNAFVPWEADKLREFEELAKRAVGFSTERGDEISVINAPFIQLDPGGEPEGFLTPDLVTLLVSLFHGLAFLLGLVLFSKFFIRPLANAVSGGGDVAVETLREEVMAKLSEIQVETGDPALAAGERVPGDLMIAGLGEDEEVTLQQQVDRLAQLRTDDSVRTIRSWIGQGGA